MLSTQKKKIVEKLSKIHLRIQSQAFAKIFLSQQKICKNFQKIRHYDIQMEAISGIVSWLKKKCQIQYLKGFYQIKSCMNNKNKMNQSQNKLFKRSPKKRVAAKTDRIITRCEIQKLDVKTQYKNTRNSTNSYHQNNDETKSSLAFLLNKVKKVNNQNKMSTNKQNQYIENHSTIRIDQADISEIKQKQPQKLKQRYQNYCKTQMSNFKNGPKNTKRQQIINKIKQLQSTLTTIKDDRYCPDLSLENDSIYCPLNSHVFSQHGNNKYYLRKYRRN